MASTGDLPPNVRSGQNFIHDPKVAGEVEVKAQIKMRFNSQFKGSFCVIRNFTLRQMKKNLTFKALDQTLSIWNPDTNDFDFLPQRCSNINQEVPFAMGVNKAVLENVVFVHQEDSNWPLSEPSNVKKRFDDIFAATKYTKALQEIKQLKNKQTTLAKEKRLELETLKSYRGEAHRLRTTIKENNRAIQAHDEKILMLQGEIQQIDVDLKALQEELEEILQKKEQTSAMKARYDILCAKVKENRDEIAHKYSENDLDLSVEQLESYREESSELMREMEVAIRNTQHSISEVESELKTIMLSKEGVLKIYGRVVGEADAYKKAVESVQKVGKEARSNFEVSVPSSVVNGTASRGEIEEFIRILRTKEDSCNADSDELKQKNREEGNALQSTIDNLNAKMSSTKEAIRMRHEQVKNNETQVDSLLKQLAEIQQETGGESENQSDMESQLKEAEDKATELEKDILRKKYDHAIQDNDAYIQECDARIQRLREERTKLTIAGESFMRKQILMQELDKLREREKAYRKRNASKIAINLGVVPSSISMNGKDLLQQAKEWIDDKENEEKRLRSAHLSLRQKLADAQALLKLRQKAVEDAHIELDELSRSLNATKAGCDMEISEEIKSLQNIKEGKMQKVNYCEAYEEIWNKEIEFAVRQGSCSSCEREFDGEEVKSIFVARKAALIRDLPDQALQIKEELQEIEKQLEYLKLAEPDARRRKTLVNSIIPKLNLEVQQASDQLMKVKIDSEAADVELESSRSSIQSSKSLYHEVITPWSQMLDQIHDHSEMLGGAQTADLDTALRSVHTVDKDLTRVEADRAKSQADRDRAAAEMDVLQERLSTARNGVHSLQTRLRRLGEGRQSKKALETKIESFMRDSEAAATTAAEKKDEMEKLEQESAALALQKQRLQSSFETDLGVLQSKSNTLKLMIMQISTFSEQMGDNDPIEVLKEMEVSLNEIEQKKASCESRLAELQLKLAEETQKLDQAASFLSQSTDMLAFKKLEYEYLSVKATLDSLGVCTAVLDREALIQKEITALQMQRSSKQSEADISSGSYSAIEDSMRKAQLGLRSKKFENIDDRYIAQMTEAQSIELACCDLDKYHKALERTLLSFHTSKMADINKTIKELWQKTYRGVDIDYIQIKADTEATTTKSSYNYRVVMYVGGAELDMRGRCSAGQKVLSCLIIRLALAENFCFNCGVLALDEPTTNLDAENSASLAEALKSLMVSRKEFESFQLIVITHDEEFARRLGTRDFVEYLWRITKDENQHSRIHREPIN
jgi:DNA repair protein RAD50